MSCKGLKEQAGELPSGEKATILSLQEEAAGMKHFSIVQIDSIEFETSKVADNPFIIDSNLITVLKNGISLPIDNSESIILMDSISRDETENVQYHFQGYNRSFNQYLIVEEMYEDERIFLIDKKDGKKTILWNRPIPDQEGRYLFNKQSNLSMVYDDVPFGFQIWEKGVGALIQVEEAKLQHNIIMDAKWTTSGYLFIKSLPINEFITQGEEAKSGFDYYKLTKRK